GYEARYQNPVGTEAKYNGNITEVDWKSASDHVLRRYDYRYDGRSFRQLVCTATTGGSSNFSNGKDSIL
ncbi:hypothetical protein, partial [uncultured Chryseobacterium sp.]|uniref:hypothetical protein n=1 Tax=uncultured Chryseobacterium sp. TaxID=259322 RepID=UPI0025EC6CEF